jgi:hypothetical protein
MKKFSYLILIAGFLMSVSFVLSPTSVYRPGVVLGIPQNPKPSIVGSKTYYRVDYQPDIPAKPIGPIYGNHTAEQSFTATTDNLAKIQIKMATYMQIIENDMEFSLILNKKVVRKVKVSGDMLTDNCFLSFNFESIKNSKGKKFTVQVKSPRSNASNSPTIWISSSDIYASGAARYNSIIQTGDFLMIVYYLK